MHIYHSLTRNQYICCVCACVCVSVQSQLEEMEWISGMAQMRSCLFVVRRCARLLMLGDTRSDVNMLLCVGGSELREAEGKMGR